MSCSPPWTDEMKTSGPSEEDGAVWSSLAQPLVAAPIALQGPQQLLIGHILVGRQRAVDTEITTSCRYQQVPEQPDPLAQTPKTGAGEVAGSFESTAKVPKSSASQSFSDTPPQEEENILCPPPTLSASFVYEISTPVHKVVSLTLNEPKRTTDQLTPITLLTL